MIGEYPVKRASSAPATGKCFYEFLLRHIAIPAAANHNIWYANTQAQLKNPDKFPFRGDIPKGKTLELITLAGNPVNSPYTFTGQEQYVLVSDLSDGARRELSIPENAPDKDKVYNSNFRAYEQLSSWTKISNELAVLSVAKSISSYLAGIEKKVNYSEKDVLNMITASFDDLSGPQMMHFLHGTHLAWSALAYIREDRNVAGAIMAEFHGQNSIDFYAKDMGTVLPALFFSAANLGKDPMKFYEKLDIEVWGAKEAAQYMQRFMQGK